VDTLKSLVTQFEETKVLDCHTHLVLFLILLIVAFVEEWCETESFGDVLFIEEKNRIRRSAYPNPWRSGNFSFLVICGSVSNTGYKGTEIIQSFQPVMKPEFLHIVWLHLSLDNIWLSDGQERLNALRKDNSVWFSHVARGDESWSSSIQSRTFLVDWCWIQIQVFIILALIDLARQYKRCLQRFHLSTAPVQSQSKREIWNPKENHWVNLRKSKR
jgi:hypothetical protein